MALAEILLFQAQCKNPMRISVFGDLYIANKYSQNAAKYFADLKPLLSWADFNIANLEGVLSNETDGMENRDFLLRMKPGVEKDFAQHKIHAVTLANNHSFDFGWPGLKDTLKNLDQAQIKYVGAGNNLAQASKALILEKNEVKAAILNYTTTYPLQAWAAENRPGVANPLNLKSDIAAAKQQADFVMVIFHWGDELSLNPNQVQENNAKLAVSAGADMVLGHHPHIAQKITTIDEKPVIYSLGNFIFTSRSEKTELSLGAHIELCFDNNTTKSQLALSTLNTLNNVTDFKTRLYSREQTKKLEFFKTKNRLAEPWIPFIYSDDLQLQTADTEE